MASLLYCGRTAYVVRPCNWGMEEVWWMWSIWW